MVSLGVNGAIEISVFLSKRGNSYIQCGRSIKSGELRYQLTYFV